MDTIVTIKLPKNAAQNPATWKPFIKLAAQNISAFMTKKKNPKVTMLKGKVKTFRIVPKVALSSPKTTATKTAVQNPATLIPGTTLAANSTPKAVNKILNIIFIHPPKFCPGWLDIF
jgi:hypothetical protein